MTQIQIPATRSEFSTFVEITDNQMAVLRGCMDLLHDELGSVRDCGWKINVTDALVAKVQKAAANSKADSFLSSSDKAAVTRVTNLIVAKFEDAYAGTVRDFHYAVKSARLEVAKGADISGWKLSWEARNDDRIEVTYATFEEGYAGRSWKRNMTNYETIRPEFTIDEAGEPAMKFVVCESGYSSIRDTDPRFETLAEAKAHALVLVDWTAALCYERLAAHVASVAAELARVELMMSMLAAAGVDHLVAA